MKLDKAAYTIPSLVNVKRGGNFVSEMNYVLPILLFMVSFCHLVVRRQSREKPVRLKAAHYYSCAIRRHQHSTRRTGSP